MPPTDKALAVMTLTEKHLAVLRDAAGRFEKSPAYHFHPPWQENAAALRDIQSVVRYLVDHPERLAGEDERVFSAAYIQKLETELPDFVTAVADTMGLVGDDLEDAQNWPYENLLVVIATLYSKAQRAAGEDEVVVKREEKK